MPQLSPNRSRRGGALVLALLVVSVMGTLALAVLQTSLDTSRHARRSIDQKRAVYLAEAGLAEAHAAVTSGKPGSIGSEDDPARFGEGLLWVEATRQATGDIVLKSIGLCGAARAEVELVVERSYLDHVKRGLFGAANLEFGPGVFIDGYDSYVGAYEHQLEKHKGVMVGEVPARIETNGRVVLSGLETQPTYVSADIAYGVDVDEVVEIGEADHDGDDDPHESELSLYAVRLPPIDRDGSRTVTSALTLPPGDSGFDDVAVGAGGELTLVGPCRVLVDDLQVLPGGTLTIDATLGAVELYVAETIALAPGSAVETITPRPGDVVLQVAGGAPSDVAPRALLEATGAFEGFVYVPASTLAIGSALEFFGGMTAASVALESGVRVHIDIDLATGEFESDLPVTPLGWQLLEVADIPLVGVHQDPFHFLGVDKVAASELHELHDLTDVHLHIEYIDALGVVHDESVWEDEFDWSNVREVIELRRHEKGR